MYLCGFYEDKSRFADVFNSVLIGRKRNYGIGRIGK